MMANPFAVIDLETTGFGFQDRIIEIGVVLLDRHGNEEGRWETLVQPGRDIPNSFVHGITATDLVHAPTFAAVARDLANVLNGRTIVAHGAAFEYRFLNNEFTRAGFDFPEYGGWTLDTAMLAPRILPGAPKSLKDSLAAIGVVNKQAHRALTDAEATAELLRHLLPKIENVPVNRGDFWLATDHAPAQEWQPVVRGDAAEETNWVGKLARKLQTTGDDALNKYRMALQAVLADREISDTELLHLQKQAEDLELGAQDVADIHEEFLRQLAVEAWLDGIVTDDEKQMLEKAARKLCVEEETVTGLLEAPLEGAAIQQLQLHIGDRVTLTGQMELPRERWEERIRSAGLTVGGISKRTAVLVAANPDSQSGKARQARKYNLPVIDEVTFARLLGEVVERADEEGQVSVDYGRLMDVDGFDGSLYDADDSAGVDSNFAERFPWLSVVNSAPGTAESVASAWIAGFSEEPVANLSPALNVETVPEQIGNSKLIYTRWLQQHEQPLSASVQDLKDLSGVGAKRLHDMVVGVVLLALDITAAEWEITAQARENAQPDAAMTQQEHERLVADGVASLRDVSLPTAPGNELLAELRSSLSTYFHTSDSRFADIFIGRTIEGKTLDEVGRQFDVTRERVRQLEKQMLKGLAEQAPLLAEVEESLAARMLPMSWIAQVRSDFPELTREVAGLGVPIGQFLSSLSTSWVLSGQWAMDPELDQRIRFVAEDLADPFGVVEAAAVAAEIGVSTGELKQRIETADGYRYLIIDERILTRANSHNDRAAAVLSMRQEPLTAEEIAVLSGTTQVRSLSNALANDDRIHKVTAKKWALADWGMEPFNTIAEWIGAQVDKTGEVLLTELVAECSRLEVAESSMRLYASSGEYVVEDGMVRRGSGDVPIDAQIEEAKAVYFRDGKWKLLLQVTFDHLRGSGFSIPRAIGAMYEVPFLGAVPLKSKLGDQEVRYNRNQIVSTATIRRFLEDLGSVEGDRVWLTFGDDRTFDVQPATPKVDGAVGMQFVLNRMGLDDRDYANDEVAMAAINEAVGLAAGTARRRTVQRFRYRQHDELADAIKDLPNI